MKESEIPDYNVFMMCPELYQEALSNLPGDYHFRNIRPDELERWKAFPFDTEEVPAEYESFMSDFVNEVYGNDMMTFYKNTLFVCDRQDNPVATCSHWKAYGRFNSIHWLKTLKTYEGYGLGRALLSKVMLGFSRSDYPILLHTQPGSFRAIKLYSDFGFKLMTGGHFGSRPNELEKCLPILRMFMTTTDFNNLKFIETPLKIIDDLCDEKRIEF